MYEKILVTVDGSPTADRGLAEAIRLARLTGGRLRVVTVFGDISLLLAVDGHSAPYIRDVQANLKKAGGQVLTAARQSADAAGVKVETTLIENLTERVSDSILQEAKGWGADVIVVGTHGRRGVRRFMLGSDAESIARDAPVPVLLVREPEAGVQASQTDMYERILVAVDGSPTSDRGLAEAIQLARLTRARLRLVNVVDEMSLAMGMAGFGAAYTGEMLQGLKDAGELILETARVTAAAQGVNAESALFEGFAGRVSDLVVEEARRWSADLIVLGTHGRRGVRRFVLGSDAEQIVRAAPVPVLLVRMEAPDSETMTGADAPVQTGIRS